MSTKLNQIVDAVRARVADAKRRLPMQEMVRLAMQQKYAPRGFRAALDRAANAGVAVIAELKKASPSRGVIRGTFPVGRLATQLAHGGAAALSVLTEEEFFLGSLENLREASAATNLPCLRKDFIVDEYQLYEARANSADAVLLIAAALDDPDFGMLHRAARGLGLDVLCEVHDETELTRAVAVGAEIVGVNSRDLRTLEVKMETHERLAVHMPGNVLRVAESGIHGGQDVRHLRGIGYQAFLVGESLMKAEDPGLALAQLIAAAKAPPLGASGVSGWAVGTKD